MILLVGLGNPTPNSQDNRHNVGFKIIDAINIPEVHDEDMRGKRPVKNLERAEAREFGRLLQDNVGIETIVNRVTVHENFVNQKNWIKEICQ